MMADIVLTTVIAGGTLTYVLTINEAGAVVATTCVLIDVEAGKVVVISVVEITVEPAKVVVITSVDTIVLPGRTETKVVVKVELLASCVIVTSRVEPGSVLISVAVTVN